MQGDQIENSSLKDLITRAYGELKDVAKVEEKVWASLPEKTRERLGRVRLRQLIAVELKDPDQLEFAIEGELFPLDEIPPGVLERRGERLIAVGEGCIKRGQAYLAEAKRRTEERA